MLSGPTFALILSIALLAEPAQAAFQYMAQCNYDPSTGFSTKVTVEKAAADAVNWIIGLSSSNTYDEACRITQVGTTNEYTVTITVNSAGTSFSPAACGSVFQTLDTDSDGTMDEITFKFLIQAVSSFITSGDVMFSWKCTKEAHNNVVIETFSVASLLVDNLGLKSKLALEVYDSSNTLMASGSELTLGGLYYFKLKHTYANSKNKEVGIYVNKLTFYQGVDSTTIPNVVSISNGCKQTPVAYQLTTNFVKETTTSVLPIDGGLAAGGSDGVYVIASGTFAAALWMTTTGISTTLKVEAVVVQCLSSDQSICDDHQTNACSVTRRRRRSAEEKGLQNVTSVATSFTISLVGGKENQGSGQNDVKGTNETCYQTYTFWILVLVFGILMMLCLIFAVYLFYRLRREKESRRKTEEKYGIINPSFK